MAHNILAIDPGIDRIGIAIMVKEGGKEKILFSQCLQTNSKDTQGKRLADIGTCVNKVIHKWEPRDLAIETLFFNQNTTSAMKVSEARGVILFMAEKNGLEIYEYSPQAVKIAVTGHGSASKTQIKSMLKHLVKIPQTKKAKIDDELDAIALGITHLASQKGI